MADELAAMRTQPIDRSTLAKFCGGDNRLMRYFESLGLDVAGPLSDNIALLLQQVQDARQLAADAQARADAGNLGLFDTAPAMLDVRPGPLTLVTRDGAGYIVAVDEGQLLAALQSMLPAATDQRPVDDAQAILATQTFS